MRLGGEIIMAKSKEDRVSFLLKCTECGEENYLTTKNKKVVFLFYPKFMSNFSHRYINKEKR